MTYRRGLVFALAAVVLIAGCGGDGEAEGPSPTSEGAATSEEPAATPAVDGAEGDPSAWPVRQKLAQMLFPGFNAGPDAPTDPGEIQALIDAGAGGVFIGRKEEGLFASSVMLDAQTNALPPLVATDGEGGQVDVLESIMEPLPPASEMAAWDVERIHSAGASRGADLLARGVNVDFAPVIDVSGGSNPLGDRTWGAEPDEVVRTAGAFAEGLCSAGVLPTLKHFPGHGRTDAHGDFAPAQTPNLASLEQLEIPTFRAAIDAMAGRSLVMTGHLDVPGLTDEGEPFSLNPEAMKYLRDTVGYDGVTVTDELAEMGAITERGISIPDAVEASLVAGNDMALYFGDAAQMNEVLDQLEEAVAEGRLSEAQVDQSLARIVALKSSDACAT